MTKIIIIDYSRNQQIKKVKKRIGNLLIGLNRNTYICNLPYRSIKTIVDILKEEESNCMILIESSFTPYRWEVIKIGEDNVYKNSWNNGRSIKLKDLRII